MTVRHAHGAARLFPPGTAGVALCAGAVPRRGAAPEAAPRTGRRAGPGPRDSGPVLDAVQPKESFPVFQSLAALITTAPEPMTEAPPL